MQVSAREEYKQSAGEHPNSSESDFVLQRESMIFKTIQQNKQKLENKSDNQGDGESDINPPGRLA